RTDSARPARNDGSVAPPARLPRRLGRRTPASRFARLLQRLEPRAAGGEIRDAGEYGEDVAAAQPAADSGVPRVMIENPDKEVLAPDSCRGPRCLAERAKAQRMFASDRIFAALFAVWERRLGELNVLVTPVDPPAAILDRIKQRQANGDPIADVLTEEPPPPAEAAPTIAPPTVEPPSAEPPPAEPPPAELFDAPPPDVAPADAVPPDVMPPAVESQPTEPTPPPRPQAEAPQREGASTAQIIELSRRARRWRGTALAIAALAAAFAGLVVVREVRPELMPD